MQLQLSHTYIFLGKVTNHIDALNDIGRYILHALSNIFWAYATAGKSHSQLFEQLADHIIAHGNLSEFKPQTMSGLTHLQRSHTHNFSQNWLIILLHMTT
jgi:hypothetical protein